MSGRNVGFQVVTESMGTKLTVTRIRNGSIVRVLDIAPQSVKHVCKCTFYINQDCFEELNRLKKSIPGPKLCLGEPQPGGDERWAIPQLIALNHTYDVDERGIGYAVATPPTLRTLAKAVIRGYRIDCHLGKYRYPTKLREELGRVEEEHHYLHLDDIESRECPCRDRYAIFPVFKTTICPKMLEKYKRPDIIWD